MTRVAASPSITRGAPSSLRGLRPRAPDDPAPLFPRFTEADVEGLLRSMSLAEKVSLLSGETWTPFRFYNLTYHYNVEPIVAGALPSRGIPGIRFTDGPRGVVMYESTCFPVAMARGATFDPELEKRVGDVIGVESRAQGANLWAGACINLLRHPAWGRAQETYGEDPVHVGAMGVAVVEGAQRHVMACIKHFACNSIENSRFYVDVRIDRRALHELYLPHFRRCVQAGAAAVMSAYNKVEGHYCGHSHLLLTEILKERWGFRGLVMSDFVLGVRDAVLGLNAGLDLEMPFTQVFGAAVIRAVERGLIPRSRIDDAVGRILRSQARFSEVGEPGRYGKDRVASKEHRALAREVAVRSMVLLRNERVQGVPALPIDRAKVRSIGVFGALADRPVVGDGGSSMVRPPEVISMLRGLREAAGQLEIRHDEGRSLAKAAQLASEVEAAIVIVGFTHADEGENVVIKGGDRSRLSLRAQDEGLILAVASACPRTIVVMIAGSAVVTERWRNEVPGILMAWYPGMEGGHALADLVFGARSPTAKLPIVFPRDPSHLPPFDARAASASYGLYHGYRELDRTGVSPAFAFGFGLGYTQFSLSQPRLRSSRIPIDGSIVCDLDVENVGVRRGAEVVQAYVSYPSSKVERPRKELKAFSRIELAPGDRGTITLEIPAETLAYFDVARDQFVVEAGKYELRVGSSSRDEDLVNVPFEISPTF